MQDHIEFYKMSISDFQKNTSSYVIFNRLTYGYNMIDLHITPTTVFQCPGRSNIVNTPYNRKLLENAILTKQINKYSYMSSDI